MPALRMNMLPGFAATLMLLGGLAGCTTETPGPGLIFFSVDISNVTGPDPDTNEITFSSAVVGGAAPYAFSWNFGGGAEPNTASSPGGTSGSSAISAVLRRGRFTVTVTATDANGVTATDSVMVDSEQNNPPAVEVSSATYSALDRVLTVRFKVTDTERDVVVLRPLLNHPYAATPAQVAVQTALDPYAEFEIRHGELADRSTPPLELALYANDGSGETLILHSDPHGDLVNIRIEPMPLAAADTLIAVPLKERATVGEAVRVLVISTQTPEQFAGCEVLLSCPGDGRPVGGSFNLGVPGGAAYAVDGLWPELNASGFAAVPDYFGTTAADFAAYSYGSRRAFPFRISPASATAGFVSGALFSVEFTFDTPGTKTFGFGSSGTHGTTRYFDGAGNAYAWGDSSNDGALAPHSVIVE